MSLSFMVRLAMALSLASGSSAVGEGVSTDPGLLMSSSCTSKEASKGGASTISASFPSAEAR